jgi:hypothetical protein
VVFQVFRIAGKVKTDKPSNSEKIKEFMRNVSLAAPASLNARANCDLREKFLEKGLKVLA